MKKFFIFVILGFAFAVGAFYMVFYQGFYLDFRPEAPVHAPFRTAGKEILYERSDHVYVPLTLRGVDVTASLPGKYASGFAADTDTYLRWLEAIGEMGANLVRVYTIMDDDFYRALYDYNTTHADPLYLLQGIQVPDVANYGEEDAYHRDFQGQLLKDGVTAVDVIHGRRVLSTAEIAEGGQYFRDVSPWVLGYMIGHEWVADTVAYTDHSLIRDGVYVGEYFSATEEATPFEAMLAEVMDRMMSYETRKYKTQRLMGFISAPNMDFLHYEQMYAQQLYKYVWLDAEHIQPEKTVRSGYYAGYRLYDFCDDFVSYLTLQQRLDLAHILSGIDRKGVYGGYLQLLAGYHSMPVIVTYGFSTSRGVVRGDEPPLTEREQGRELMEVWQEAMEAGIKGVSLSSWQDTWERRTWNTSFAVELTNNYLWHNLQGDGQNYGLMAFEPGEEAVCLVDGDSSEWAEDEPVLQEGDYSLFLRQDQKALYLLIQGEGVRLTNRLYVPIDLLDTVGHTASAAPALTFDRPVDFILQLDGTMNSCLLVQERYDAMRMNFNFEQGGTDPFVDVPPLDGDRFSVVSMAAANTELVDLNLSMILSPREMRELRAMHSYQTGRLMYGNGNPEAENYHSLADFCYGNGCVEIRLPWLLLNIADPVDKQLHQDYYLHYGVTPGYISSCWMGLGDGETAISLQEVPLERLSRRMVWRERLKKSYDVVQEYWT